MPSLRVDTWWTSFVDQEFEEFVPGDDLHFEMKSGSSMEVGQVFGVHGLPLQSKQLFRVVLGCAWTGIWDFGIISGCQEVFVHISIG